MKENAITIRDVLNIDNFDPMAIDVSEFEELAKSMPRDANIDIYTAETLAAQYLRAADRCAEILSTLIWFEGRAKASKGAIRNRLYLESKDAGYKTVEERKAYAESADAYIDADNLLATAYAARKNFEMRHDFFLKSHQYMKERLRGEQKLQMSSGFSETAGGKSFGEGSW
jgi:hypothetical protein